MANFDTLREEFDRMTPEDQFRLGVAGVLRMAQDRSDLSMPSDRSGYSVKKMKSDETDISKDSIAEMSTGLSSKLYRVKITDAFKDVVAPLSVAMGAISDMEKVHKNRLHHENTLYYQGIIGAIEGLGESNRQSFARAIYLNYQSFLRHPMWSTVTALNDFLIKPIAKLGIGALFGFGKKSDTDRIVDAIKEQTQFMRTGVIESPSTMSQIINRGVIGFLAQGAFENIMSAFRSPVEDNSNSKKTVDILNDILSTNIGIFKTVSNMERNSSPSAINSVSRLADITKLYSIESLTALSSLTNINSAILDEIRNNWQSSNLLNSFSDLQAANDEVVSAIKMTGTDAYQAINNLNNAQQSTMNLIDTKFGETSKDFQNFNKESINSMRENFSDLLNQSSSYQTTVEGFYERQLMEQMTARKELEEHNKRERMRTAMGLLGGGALKLAGLGAIVASAMGVLPESIRGAIWEGFKFIGNVAGGVISGVSSQLSPSSLGMLIGGALMFTPFGRTLGIIMTSMSYITKKINDWVFSKSNAADEMQAATNALNFPLGQSLDTFSQIDTTFLMTREREMNSLLEQRQSIEEAITDARERRQGTERSDELIRLNGELRDIETRLNNIDSYDGMAGKISPYAMRSALAVAGAGRNNSSRGMMTSSDALLSFIAEHESKGNYNALVYGNNTPSETDLTSMSIREVLEYQSGMRQRGHASSAVGRYQFLKGTLEDAVRATGVDMDAMFDEDMQDKLARDFLLKRRGFEDFQRGEISAERFASNLANEWASLPTSNGQSAYQGIAGNRAGTSYENLMSVLGRGRTSALPANPATTQTAGISSLLDVFTGGQMGGDFVSSISGAVESIMSDFNPQNEERQSTSVISESSIDVLSRRIASAISTSLEETNQGGGISISGVMD